VQHLYGETETGGTQNLLLADVPFENLGLPRLGDESRARLSESIQHTLYGGMFAPTLLLGGLVFAVYRNSRDERAPDENQADEQAVGDLNAAPGTEHAPQVGSKQKEGPRS
jgi:hypothetical protein